MTIGLQVDLAKLKKITTHLVGIEGKPIEVKGSVELPIILGDKDHKRTMMQSFMVVKINAYTILYLVGHY